MSKEYRKRTEEIFQKLMETEELGNQTAKRVTNTLNLISNMNREQNERVADQFEGLSPADAKMATSALDKHFITDMNNLLNFLRSGFTKEQSFERLHTLNDGWKNYPTLANAMKVYSMDDRIEAAARGGAKYEGGFDEASGQLTFTFPKNTQERLEMV